MVYLNLIFATTRNTFKNLVSKKENIFFFLHIEKKI